MPTLVEVQKFCNFYWSHPYWAAKGIKDPWLRLRCLPSEYLLKKAPNAHAEERVVLRSNFAKKMSGPVAALNDKGFQIYYFANVMPLGLRTYAKDADTLQHLWLWHDFDFSLPMHITDLYGEFGFPPGIVVRTSEREGVRRYQVLLGIDVEDGDGAKLDRCREVLGEFIWAFGADPSTKNPSRILRMPGFVNWKGKEKKEEVSEAVVEWPIFIKGVAATWALEEIWEFVEKFKETELSKELRRRALSGAEKLGVGSDRALRAGAGGGQDALKAWAEEGEGRGNDRNAYGHWTDALERVSAAEKAGEGEGWSAKKGQRHHALCSWAGQMAREGVSPRQIVKNMRVLADKGCQGGYGEKRDFELLVRDALKFRERAESEVLDALGEGAAEDIEEQIEVEQLLTGRAGATGSKVSEETNKKKGDGENELGKCEHNIDGNSIPGVARDTSSDLGLLQGAGTVADADHGKEPVGSGAEFSGEEIGGEGRDGSDVGPGTTDEARTDDWPAEFERDGHGGNDGSGDGESEFERGAGETEGDKARLHREGERVSSGDRKGNADDSAGHGAGLRGNDAGDGSEGAGAAEAEGETAGAEIVVADLRGEDRSGEPIGKGEETREGEEDGRHLLIVGAEYSEFAKRLARQMPGESDREYLSFLAGVAIKVKFAENKTRGNYEPLNHTLFARLAGFGMVRNSELSVPRFDKRADGKDLLRPVRLDSDQQKAFLNEYFSAVAIEVFKAKRILYELEIVKKQGAKFVVDFPAKGELMTQVVKGLLGKICLDTVEVRQPSNVVVFQNGMFVLGGEIEWAGKIREKGEFIRDEGEPWFKQARWRMPNPISAYFVGEGVGKNGATRHKWAVGDRAAFAEYLEQTFEGEGNEVTREDLIGRIIGYCMVRGNPFQKFFAFIGSAGAGKGVLCELIESLCGDWNSVRTRYASLGDPWGFGTFEEKIFVIAEEAESADRAIHEDAMSAIKAYTGSDKFALRKMREDERTVEATAKIIVTANKDFSVTDSSGALQRRLVCLYFGQVKKAEDQIDSLGRKMFRQEGDEIATWAVLKLGEAWSERARLFYMPESEALGEGRREIEKMIAPVLVFCRECVVSKPGKEIAAGVIEKLVKILLAKDKIGKFSGKIDRNIKDSMIQLGFRRQKTNEGMRYTDCTLSMELLRSFSGLGPEVFSLEFLRETRGIKMAAKEMLGLKFDDVDDAIEPADFDAWNLASGTKN